MSKKKSTFTLTGIIIRDIKSRGYTAYFAEFPEAVADGVSKDEAAENLIEALQVMLETRKMESDNEAGADRAIIKQKFEFELA